MDVEWEMEEEYLCVNSERELSELLKQAWSPSSRGINLKTNGNLIITVILISNDSRRLIFLICFVFSGISPEEKTVTWQQFSLKNWRLLQYRQYKHSRATSPVCFRFTICRSQNNSVILNSQCKACVKADSSHCDGNKRNNQRPNLMMLFDFSLRQLIFVPPAFWCRAAGC